MPSTLAVVIPAYNAANTIAEAIASAIAVSAAEVIVVDDGSTDGTAEIAAEHGATVRTQSNAGAAIARQHGASTVTSDYVIFLDADDLLIPEGVAGSIAVLDANPAVAVSAGVVIGFSRRNDTRKRAPIRYQPINIETLLTMGFGPWPPANATVRVSALRESELIDVPALHPRFADDYELLLRLAMVGEIDVRDDPACLYCMDGGKSVRSAHAAITAKEQIRSHYSKASGVEISLMTPAEIDRAAMARVSRAKLAAGDRLGFVTGVARWVAANPRDSVRRALRRLRPRRRQQPPQRAVFVWATGQAENIGDSLLRRPYLDTLRRLAPLHVWTRGADSSFLEGMGIRASEDRIIPNFRRWARAALKSAIAGRTTLALNAGEVPVSRRGAAQVAVIGAIGGVARLRGGSLLWLGAGIPRRRSIFTIPYRIVGRFANVMWVRDAESLDVVPRAGVNPDWAFALGEPTAQWAPTLHRDRLAVSLRGDRPFPSDTWIAWLGAQASQHNLTVVSLAQVGRDDAWAQKLHAALGGELVLFADASHAVQEARVRDVYRQSRIAVSDRLHVLIVAASEGAVPFGWVETSQGKIRRHFDAVAMTWVGAHEGRRAEDLPELALPTTPSDLATAVDAARDRLEQASRLLG